MPILFSGWTEAIEGRGAAPDLKLTTIRSLAKAGSVTSRSWCRDERIRRGFRVADVVHGRYLAHRGDR